MVGVEKGQGLLLDNKEDGVNELEVFREVIHLVSVSAELQHRRLSTNIVQDDQVFGPASLVIANGVENTSFPQSGQKLLNEESQQTATDDGQIEVVHHERTVQHKWLPVPHYFSASKNDYVVCGQRNDRLLYRRHVCLSGLEFEVLRRIAEYGRVEFAEDRPYFDTKWPVDGGHADLHVFEKVGHRVDVLVLRAALLKALYAS